MVEDKLNTSNEVVTDERKQAIDVYEELVVKVFFEYGIEAVLPLLDEIVNEISNDPDFLDELSGDVQPKQLISQEALRHPKVISNKFALKAIDSLHFLVHFGTDKSSREAYGSYIPMVDRILLREHDFKNPLGMILVLMTSGDVYGSNTLWHEFIHSFQRENSFFYKGFLMYLVFNTLPFLFHTQPHLLKIVGFIDVVCAFYVLFKHTLSENYKGKLHFSELHAGLAGDSIMAVPDVNEAVNNIYELYGPILDEKNTKERLRKAGHAILGLRSLGVAHTEIAKLSADKNADQKLEVFLKDIMTQQDIDDIQLEIKINEYIEKRKNFNSRVKLQTMAKVKNFLVGFNPT